MKRSHVPRFGRRLRVSTVAIGLTAFAVATGGLGLSGASASSHREAPLIAGDPKADNTDVYAFVSPDAPDSVTLIANWIPFEEPNGGPNFYPFATDARYNINIDNNGDGKADLTYRWVFRTQDLRDGTTFLYNNGPVTSLTDPNLLFRQFYDLQLIRPGMATTVLARNVPVAPSFTGKASMPDYGSLRNAAVKGVSGGGKTFAGQADDSFFVDLRVFDLLYGGDLSETGQDTLAGYNVNSVAIQLPKNAVALKGSVARNPVIGVWSTTERQALSVVTKYKVIKYKTRSGKVKKIKVRRDQVTTTYRQVSRLGNPLINEVIVPTGLKDTFNRVSPDVDHTVAPLVDRVLNPEVPKLIESIYGIPAPMTPRNDLVEIFLTGISKNSGGPIQADLNSQLLNQDVVKSRFVPAEELRLNLSVAPTASPDRLGVLAGDFQGFPNGRRLTDDVLDIALQALEGAALTGVLVPALATGDGVNANDKAFGSSFPYVALPNTDAVTATAAAAAAVVPSGGGSSGGTIPALPAVSGLGALALLGTGGLMAVRRRSENGFAVPSAV